VFFDSKNEAAKLLTNEFWTRSDMYGRTTLETVSVSQYTLYIFQSCPSYACPEYYFLHNEQWMSDFYTADCEGKEVYIKNL